MHKASILNEFDKASNHKGIRTFTCHNTRKEYLVGVQFQYKHSRTFLVTIVPRETIISDKERDSSGIVVDTLMMSIRATGRHTLLTPRVVWKMRQVVSRPLSWSHLGRRWKTLGRESAWSVLADGGCLTPNNGVSESNIILSHDFIICVEVLHWLTEMHPTKFRRA